jgi:hypothetical protein
MRMESVVLCPARAGLVEGALLRAVWWSPTPRGRRSFIIRVKSTVWRECRTGQLVQIIVPNKAPRRLRVLRPRNTGAVDTQAARSRACGCSDPNRQTTPLSRRGFSRLTSKLSRGRSECVRRGSERDRISRTTRVRRPVAHRADWDAQLTVFPNRASRCRRPVCARPPRLRENPDPTTLRPS